MNKTGQKKENRVSARLSDRRGMTMAEMLITVAIIIILMAVGFIAVSVYQRSLAQIQRDGYAKEIFIAAQNHLTMARGEGYFGVTGDSSTITAEEKTRIYGVSDNDEDIFLFLVNDGKRSNGSAAYNNARSETILDLMLPFGALDETVRMGGSYVVRYQPKAGKVLDVFYCTTSGSPQSFNLTIGNDNWAAVSALTGSANKSSRRNYNGAVIGWYGGEDAETLAEPLKAPDIDVVNGDTLYVRIKNPNPSSDLRLIITGLVSGAKKGISISTAGSDPRLSVITPTGTKEYKYTLDDITVAGRHFANLGQDTSERFIAGEDVRIEAVAYSSDKLANIVFSKAETENSLYESIADPEDTPTQHYSDDQKLAFVSSIRHLENLSETISHTGYTDAVNGGRQLKLLSASQTADMDWDTFIGAVSEAAPGTGTSGTSVFAYNSPADAGGYFPVNTEEAIIYDGLRHSISNVEADYTAETGLFGITRSGSKIKNLELIDFDIKGGSSTGSLIGYANSTSVRNVSAYNTGDFEEEKNLQASVSSGGSSSAGGLVGTMHGGSVRYGSASLIVQGGSYAGGLIGYINTGTDEENIDPETAAVCNVTASYSGGHTERAEYYKHKDNGDRDTELYNVRAAAAAGTAGGLIGRAGQAAVANSYTTCSVEGALAGGFVGSSGGSISHCYSTGLVSGEGSNAFIGNGTPAVDTAENKTSSYFSIVNETENDGGVEYKEAGIDNIDAVDTDTASYESFAGGSGVWNDAMPYDSYVKGYYNDRFNLLTVTQLETISEGRAKSRTEKSDSINETGSLFVNTHHGDWPAPEIFVIND